MELKEKQISSQPIFNGRIICIRVDEAELPNGAVSIREVVEHNGGVCVVALTEQEEVLMVEQFRYPYGKTLLEIPAGKRDGDEDTLLCGQRELKEETGVTAKNWRFLGELYPSPAYCDEVVYTYLATDLSYGETNPDEDEFLTLHKIPLDTLVQMVLRGEIKDAKTQTALLKVAMERGKHK